MAIVGQQVRIAGGDDYLVATKKEVIVDPERGIAVEVEKQVVAVDLGDGRIAVREQQRVTGAAINTPLLQVNGSCKCVLCLAWFFQASVATFHIIYETLIIQIVWIYKREGYHLCYRTFSNSYRGVYLHHEPYPPLHRLGGGEGGGLSEGEIPDLEPHNLYHLYEMSNNRTWH